NMGQSAVGDRSNMHAGADLGATLWIAEGIGLSYIAGAKTMFGTDLSEYIQHTFELTYRFGEGDNQRSRIEREHSTRVKAERNNQSTSMNRSPKTTSSVASATPVRPTNRMTTLNPAPSYIDKEITKVERLSVYERYPFLLRDIAKVSRGIFFAYNSAELSRPEVTDFILPEVITEMNKRPNVKITVTGHTDLVGSEGYNYKLSLARAQAVADFLIEGGIAKERITVRALGENEPVVKSEREAALNRRVVITEDKD
ncbi:MAG: OmpA family protein, partial [Flavobacteriaceae bacterium]